MKIEAHNWCMIRRLYGLFFLPLWSSTYGICCTAHRLRPICNSLIGDGALLSYLLTDEAYVIAITRYRKQPNGISPYAHWYFLGVGLGLWITWQISTAVGVFLGAQIPTTWSLDFALPLTFIALVVPALKDRATIATAIVASVIALLALTMPLKLGLMTALLVAIGTGYAVERWGQEDKVTGRQGDRETRRWGDRMTRLWVTLIAIGLITFAYRFSFIFFLERIRLPSWLNRALRFVPVAALTAITVPELLVQSDVLDFTWQNERLLAGVLAALVAWRTHNIFFTIGLGMVCLYSLQWLGI